MAAYDTETPVKMCLTAIEKKVRNLEKRKVGTLDQSLSRTVVVIVVVTLIDET